MLKKVFTILLAIFSLLTFASCNKKPETVAEQIQSFEDGYQIEVHLEEKLSFSKKLDSHSWNIQGGCNDGTYGYFAINNGGDSGESLTRIYKVDLATWEIVKISNDLYLGHGNDITYMPEEKQLIVTWCEDPATNASVVNAETLEVVSTVTYPQKHNSMTYSPERKSYVFGNWTEETGMTIYNEDLTFVGETTFQYSFAQQGITCDKDFIYILQSPKSAGDEGYIFVYNWDCEPIHIISFPIEYEVENISVLGDKLIVTANDHHNEKKIRFYEVTLS